MSPAGELRSLSPLDLQGSPLPSPLNSPMWAPAGSQQTCSDPLPHTIDTPPALACLPPTPGASSLPHWTERLAQARGDPFPGEET